MAHNFDNTNTPFRKYMENQLDSLEDEELRTLLHKELENEPYSNDEFELNRSLADDERRAAVDWMLRVVGCYSLSTVTAILAVNYFDRFFLNTLHKAKETKPWMIQLSAVACLSLAAKVEETHVPLLTDLQVEECKYVFEPKTIQRMELLVLSTLQWKMHPVTVLSFIEYVSRRFESERYLKREFLKRCECLLLFISSDCRFMSYHPSTLATSVIIYVISSLEPCYGIDHQDQLMGIFGINKDKVKDCCLFIQEVISTVHFISNNKRKFGSSSIMPQSPKGVVDVCFSTDSSSNDSWEFSSVASSVSSSPEPALSKKMKSQDP